MPLVELKNLINNIGTFKYYYGGAGNFTQKNLKYSKDQQGGSYSGEPYVQFPLPEKAKGDELDYYASNRASLDFPIRGGNLQFINGGVIVAKAAEYDRIRIGKFLKSYPKGQVFKTKQIGLQLSNPKLEVGQQANLAPGLSTARFYGVIENTRIYNNGMNTLVQVANAGSGVHADRHGTVPYNPYGTTYERVVKSYNTKDEGQGNRLVTLLNNKILKTGKTPVNPNNPADPANTLFFDNLNNLIRLGIPKGNQDVLFQYPGGPGSVYGIGLTTIHRYVNTQGPDSNKVSKQLYTDDGRNVTPEYIFSQNTKTEKNPFPQTPGYFRYIYLTNITQQQGSYATIKAQQAYVSASQDTALNTLRDPSAIKNNGAKTFNYNLVYNQASLPRNWKDGNLTDFRDTINKAPGGVNTFTTDKKGKAVKYADLNMQKRLGIAGPEQSDKVSSAGVGENYNKDNGINDLIKFRFEAVEYDTEKVVPLIFRAYLSNFQDRHTGDYNGFKYTGRGENFYTYSGFTRSISFSFKIAAESKQELKPLYNKFNYLLSQVYPDYNKDGFMRTPLIKLTVGDYILQQPGFLTSLDVTIDDNTTWEINLDGDAFEVPQVLSVGCQFTPIHDFLPRRSRDKVPEPIVLQNTAAPQGG